MGRDDPAGRPGADARARARAPAVDDPRVDAVVAELRRSLAYWQVRRAVKEAVIKPDVRLDDDVESGVRAVMESAGLANRVRNFAFAMRERLPADGARASAASTARRSSDRGGADVARDAGVHADADEDEDASGAFPPIVETHRAWKREIIARLERLAASSGVPLAQAAEGTRPPDEGADADRVRGRRAGANRASSSSASSAASAAAASSSSSSSSSPVPSSLGATSGPALAASVATALERVAFAETLRCDLGHAYDADDLLAATLSIRSAAKGPSCSTDAWGLARFALKPPSLGWLREFFRDLAPDFPQVGVDDMVDSAFADARAAETEALLRGSDASVPRCRAHARRGAPASHRPALWCAALGAPEPGNPAARATFQRLCDEAAGRRLLADHLIAGDAAATCDHPNFFPFEESLRAVLLAFSRDRSVAAETRRGAGARALRVEAVGGSTSGSGVSSLGEYPPSGVVPFRGLASLAAPACYLYPHPADALAAFTRLYARLLWRTHAVGDASTAPSPALPGLLRAFEALVHRAEPEACHRLERLGVPAARVAAPWLVAAFAEHLEVEQVLLLWDRVIGFDSTLVLAVAAAAIVSFRRDAILKAESAEEIREAFEDLSAIRIVPLAQEFLFRDEDEGEHEYEA